MAPSTLHARLTAAPRGASGAEGAAQVHVTRAPLAALSTMVEQIRILSEQIDEQLALHADAHIFTSLPRAGTVRAARLLAEIGDCPARFPTPEALACLAGVVWSSARVTWCGWSASGSPTTTRWPSLPSYACHPWRDSPLGGWRNWQPRRR